MRVSGLSSKDTIRIDFNFQRGGALFVDTGEKVTIDADNLTNDEPLWTKFKMFPGGRPATLTFADQSCIIRYGEDKKVYLSGDALVYIRWNGLEPQEIEDMDGAWPERLVIEE